MPAAQCDPRSLGERHLTGHRGSREEGEEEEEEEAEGRAREVWREGGGGRVGRGRRRRPETEGTQGRGEEQHVQSETCAGGKLVNWREDGDKHE